MLSGELGPEREHAEQANECDEVEPVSLGDDGAEDPARAGVVEVWPDHVDAIAVFRLCPVSGIGHMGGIAWIGIEPAAIRSACLLLRLCRTAWPDIAEDVAYMGECVASERNRKAAERARR